MTIKIEWTDEIWNPITGCSKISPGCQNCYAEKRAKKLKGRFGYPSDDPFKVTFHPDKLDQPLKWKKPRMIFVCSMGDLFHEEVNPEWIIQIIKSCIEANRKQYKHCWLFLTKRPHNILKWREWGKDKYPQIIAWFQHKAWLGVTAENQEQADKRIPILLQIPAAVRFVSIEPMLSEVSLKNHVIHGKGEAWIYYNFLTGARTSYVQGIKEEQPGGNKLDWVICGCESGPKRRKTKYSWIMNLKDQCVDAKVPFFLKQIDLGGILNKMPTLDGLVWDQYPKCKY
jgi:protein gp37